MDNGLREFQLLQKKYTRLRDNLDPKSIRSQIYGEVYNEIIEDAKKGIERAESRNENAALHLHDASNNEVAVCGHLNYDEGANGIKCCNDCGFVFS